MVMRDLMLAEETGAHLHIAHVSTAKSVALIEEAKRRGVRVTAETCPHYFSLTEKEVLTHGTAARVNPPLRTEKDVSAIITGLQNGVIDAIATDHAPHAAEEKALPLEEAPSGISGLETSLAVALTYLYHPGHLELMTLIDLMSTAPAAILGLDKGRIGPGDAADIVIFDLNEEWTVTPSRFYSRGKSTPFADTCLKGRVKYTICQGRIVYRD
jgi:dihydroorotase